MEEQQNFTLDNPQAIEDMLQCHPYLNGVRPGLADVQVFEELQGNPPKQSDFPLFYNWFRIMRLFAKSMLQNMKGKQKQQNKQSKQNKQSQPKDKQMTIQKASKKEEGGQSGQNGKQRNLSPPPIVPHNFRKFKYKKNFGVSDAHVKLPNPAESRQGLLRIKAVLENAESYFGKRGVVGGWVKTLRKQRKDVVFVALNDGSCQSNLQIVIDKVMPNFSQIQKVRAGASLKITGLFVKSQGKGQLIEVQCNDPVKQAVQICGICDPKTYPMSKKFHKPEFLRKNAHLRVRTQLCSGMARVRNALAFATHLFFQSRGFLYVHTPLITASDCEGAGEMFQVTTILPDPNEEYKLSSIPQKKKKKKKVIDYRQDFFGKPAFLTVSGQLAVENYCCALNNVYTFGPTFRAELSYTSRHISEFWMIEPEIAFGDLEDDMELAESYIKFLIKYCLDNLKDDIEFFENRKGGQKGLVGYLEGLINTPYKRLTYTEGIKILEQHIAEGKVDPPFEEQPYWGIDLGSEHERYLCEKVFHGPVIHYNYPKDIKAFYMRMNEDNKTVAAMDILVPGIGELVGGSQREERLDKLDQRIKEMNLNKEDYWWYRDLRRYGTVKHSGFGLGFERCVMLVSGIKNIRDAIPYPRYPGNAEF